VTRVKNVVNFTSVTSYLDISFESPVLGESSGGMVLRDEFVMLLEEENCESSSEPEPVIKMVLQFSGPLAC
jgi:hypothetical protein